MLVVSDIMTQHIDRVESARALGDVAALMARAGISAVVVADADRLVGIATARDVLDAMHQGQAPATPVATVMSTPLIAVPPQLDSREAYQLAAANGVRHLAVTDAADIPIGIVTAADFGCHRRLTLAAGDHAVAGLMDLWRARHDEDERLRLAASVFAQAREGILITDAAGMIVEVNRSFTELTGYARDEIVGRNPSLLKSSRQDQDFYQRMWQTLLRDGHWRGEIWNRKKNGDEYAEFLTISCVRDDDGKVSHYVGASSDITVLKEHQKRIEDLAHYDALTQLPNRALLADRMQLALAQAQRSGQLLAVCYLDLDDFKPVNDALGRDAGDRLLIEVAQRLKSCMRSGDTVARFGGDEFALLLAGIENVEECERALVRILASLAAAFTLDGATVSISAGIGVTLYPHDGASPDTLLRHADQAMYLAKQAGRNRYHLYDAENDRRARAHREAFERIEAAHRQGEFRLYFQPKVDIRRGTVIGAEALIRWLHPELGVVAPADFLPVIEDTDFSLTLGDWVIGEALRQMEIWVREGIDLHVSVNISARQLQEPEFARRLAGQLAAHPTVRPQQLELEILETAALEDINRVHTIIEECHKLGVSFALDDFGTGYSSLTYLKRLPARILKIDQSFVRDMLEDPEDLAIIEGVIGLSNAFHRQVIAEGVETAQHGMLLLQLGCDQAQGFGIARPMPGDDIPAWVSNYKPDPAWTSSLHLSREDFPLLAFELDHNRWIERIAALLNDGHGAGPVHPPLDHRECRFGRWYAGAGKTRYGELDSFRKLAPLHDQVHQTGRDLLNLYQAGHVEQARGQLPELYDQRDRLLEQLRKLQADASVSANQARH